jgi:hypothetical protein
MRSVEGCDWWRFNVQPDLTAWKKHWRCAKAASENAKGKDLPKERKIVPGGGAAAA